MCLINWGGGIPGGLDLQDPAGVEEELLQLEPVVLMQGRLFLALVRESLVLGTTMKFPLRLIPLEGTMSE